MKPEQIAAIVNPVSGKGKGEKYFQELQDLLDDYAIEGVVTQSKKDVENAARKHSRDADLLIVIGGDGTLGEVASAQIDAGEQTPLFLVPAGRGNSTYRHIYGDSSWRDLAGLILNGFEPHTLDVGVVDSKPRIDTSYFVLGFTAGIFRSAVVNSERYSALPGRIAYILGTTQALIGGKAVEAEIDIDDEYFYSGDARLIAIGGGRYRGSDFELFPDSKPGDGFLHCVVVEPSGFREAVSMARQARKGELHKHTNIHYEKGHRVDIDSDNGLPIEIDGSPIDTQIDNAEIEVDSELLRYAVPKENK